ncbi:MAG TPA: hypothetical protein VG676_05310, partial [Chitinophagaceae bacterium]|nr:hypothetical protein [Chitinophagaceae bacterium]
MRAVKIFTSVLVSCLLLQFQPVYGQVKLPQMIRDSMILQRDTKINIWGWASKGEKVTVKFNGKTYKTKTGDNGKWMMQLPSMSAG